MTREEELSEVIIKARKELSEIEDKKRLKSNVLLLNRCFKYLNCYSCPKDDNDRWWLYRKILKLNERGDLISLFFEVDKYGEIRIHQDDGHVSDGWIEINQNEFYDEWHKLLDKIKSIKF